MVLNQDPDASLAIVAWLAAPPRPRAAMLRLHDPHLVAHEERRPPDRWIAGGEDDLAAVRVGAGALPRERTEMDIRRFTSPLEPGRWGLGRWTGRTDMNLPDKMGGETASETVEQTGERLRTIIGQGLDLFERGFGLAYALSAPENDEGSEAESDPVAPPGHAPVAPPERASGAVLDEAPRQRPGSGSAASEAAAGEADEGEEYPVEEDASEGNDRAPPDILLEFHEEGDPESPFDLLLGLFRLDMRTGLLEVRDESKERAISEAFGIKFGELAKVVSHLRQIRSKCPGARGRPRKPKKALFREKFAGPSEVVAIRNGEEQPLNLNESLYGTITLLRHMLISVRNRRSFYLAKEWGPKVAVQLNRLPPEILSKMDFPDNWMDHPIWQDSIPKPVERIGGEHDYNYESVLLAYEALPDARKAEVTKRTQAIKKQLVERGWDIVRSRMDSCEWSARAAVMKSVLGMEDDGQGFSERQLNHARAMTNGSDDEDDLLTALNDYYAEKIDKDCVWACIPKGASDEAILETIDRWMKFDLKRRVSKFYERLFFRSTLERRGGSIVTIKDIQGISVPSYMNIIEEGILSYRSGHELPLLFTDGRKANRPDLVSALRQSEEVRENLLRFFGACRHALMARIGEHGIVRISYNNYYAPWPEEVVLDLDKANPAFKAEVEEEYKLRDPEKVGCGSYDAPFYCWFMPENDLVPRLLEKLPAENPFGSVDSALYFAYRYYFGVIERKLLKKVTFSRPGEFMMDLNCTKLIAEGTGKFKATFKLFFEIEDVHSAESDFLVPLDVEEVKGEFHLNIKKMQMRCSRDADGVVRKIARKVSRMDV